MEAPFDAVMNYDEYARLGLFPTYGCNWPITNTVKLSIRKRTRKRRQFEQDRYTAPPGGTEQSGQTESAAPSNRAFLRISRDEWDVKSRSRNAVSLRKWAIKIP